MVFTSLLSHTVPWKPIIVYSSIQHPTAYQTYVCDQQGFSNTFNVQSSTRTKGNLFSDQMSFA